jgi:hypothetical protein
MRLVYKTDPTRLVKVGDVIEACDGTKMQVMHFKEPHKPASEGKVSVRPVGADFGDSEYYVSVIGAEWVDREDRS